MPKYLVFLVCVIALVSGAIHFSLAQSTPTATITNGSGSWTPNEQGVRVSWNSTNFGTTPVISSLSLVKSTGEVFSLWSSGINPGNFRSGTKTFNLTTTGAQATIRLSGQSTGGVTVPTGNYRLFINLADNSTRPTLEAEAYSSSFDILPNVSCPITVNKSGQGTVSSNPATSLPAGQTGTVFYSPATNYLTTLARYKIGDGLWSPAAITATGGHFALPACPSSGATITAEVTFSSSAGCPLELAKSPVGGGTLSTPGLVNGKIPAGGSVTITATANPGFTFRDFYITPTTPNGGTKTQNPVTVTCPTGSTATQSVTANFVAGTCPVTGTAGAGGTISPTTGTKNVGQTQSFTARASAGYVIDKFFVQGVEVTGASNQASKTSSATCTSGNPVTASVSFKPAPGCNFTKFNYGNGSVTSNPNRSIIPVGSSNQITIIPNGGYVISDVKVNNVSQGRPGFLNLSCPTAQDKELEVWFAPATCSVVSRVDNGNGRITPTIGTANNAAQQSFTATANDGYVIGLFKINGQSVSGAFMEKAFTASKTCNAPEQITAVATFIPNQCFLSGVVGGTGWGGTITPTAEYVDGGTNANFSVEAYEGNVIKKFSINGQEIARAVGEKTAQSTFLCSQAYPENYNAEVIFRREGCAFSGSVNGSGGSVNPQDALLLTGNQIYFMAQASDNFVIDTINVNGSPMSGVSGLRTVSRPISCIGIEDINAVATFKPAGKCTITSTAGPGGTIDPLSAEIDVGSRRTISASASTGHVLTGFVVDGNRIPIASGDRYKGHDFNCTTAKAVTASATFAPATCVLTGTAGPNGSIDPTQATVGVGVSKSISATASSGYVIDRFRVDERDVADASGKVTASKNYTCSSAKSVYSLATFKVATWSIDATAGKGGKIEPAGKIILKRNESKTFKITPDSGFEIAKVLVDNKNIGTVSSVKISYASGRDSRTVEALFKPKEFSITSSVTNPVGGTIEPLGKIVLPVDKTQKYKITPKTGWVIDLVTIDRQVQTSPKSEYTLGYVPSASGSSDRTISVTFKPECFAIKPEDTLKKLRAGQPAQINKSDFREWVKENEKLVKETINSFQCGQFNYLDESLDQLVSAYYLGTFFKRPLLLTYRGIDASSGEDWGHAVIVVGIKSATNPVTGDVDSVEISHIDPNGPGGISKFICKEIFDEDTNYRRTECNASDSPTVPTGQNVYLSTYGATEINAMLSSLKSVRKDAISWVKQNHTPFENYTIPESDGVCYGWSQFNAMAAQLIMECPWQGAPVGTTAVVDSSKISSRNGFWGDLKNMFYLKDNLANIWVAIEKIILSF